MGRSLFGNSVSAATLKLSTLCGNVSSTIKDSVTTSASSAIPGGFWGYDGGTSYATANSRRQNSVAEQQWTSGPAHTSVLQDPLSNYTYVNGPANYSGSTQATGVVYDENLSIVYSWKAGAPPFAGNLLTIRLYNSALYFFSFVAAGLEIRKVALPSGAVTTYSTPASSGWSSAAGYSGVFNWPVAGKFWIFASQASTSPYESKVWTFDLTSLTFTQFGVTLSGASPADRMSNFFAMHVKADGTAVSIANSNNNGEYGTAIFTTTTATNYPWSTSGHWYWSRSGGYYVLANNNKYKVVVTDAAVVDTAQLTYGTSGSTYYNALGWLQGGSAVTFTEFAGASPNSYPMDSPTVHPSLALHDQFVVTYNTLAGTYPISVVGSTLTIGARRSAAYAAGTDSYGAIPSKFSDSMLTYLDLASVNSASAMFLRNIQLSKNSGTVAFTFTADLSAQNGYGFSYSSHPGPSSFVTATGKFFSMSTYNSQGSSGTNRVILSTLPLMISSSTKSYNATVIGGGGASSGTDGQSTQFNGLAAAPGTVRTGFVAGSTVFVSGPSRGTGGTGYGDDGWGQGEDTNAVGSYGGGSGYVTLGTITLNANEPYPYLVGFGPQYGKQGAILLSEV